MGSYFDVNFDSMGEGLQVAATYVFKRYLFSHTPDLDKVGLMHYFWARCVSKSRSWGLTASSLNYKGVTLTRLILVRVGADLAELADMDLLGCCWAQA